MTSERWQSNLSPLWHECATASGPASLGESASESSEMEFGAVLNEKHRTLSERFSDLASERGDLPVFAVEHGLDKDALESLRASLAAQLELDPHLRSANWSWRYLPLLVVATEVGYRYRGTGTDFWPVLSRELGIETGSEFRIGIARLFELGHDGYHLARPGNSAWERHFPYIAWPIGNGLVPLEIQPQLADALRRSVRAGISAEDTGSLLGHLKMLAAGHVSRRFENWLERDEVALEVVRRLLATDSDGWLSHGILQRIDSDIRSNVGAFRAISEARRMSARRASRLSNIPSSRWVISIVEDVPKYLLIRGPALPADLRNEVIAALRIQGDKVRVVSSGQSIPLRLFLAGGEIELGSVGPLPESPLSRGDAFQVPQGLAASVLEALQPAQAGFFQIEPAKNTASAVFPNETLNPDVSVIQWLRTGEDGSPEFRRLNTSSDADAELLRRHGFTVLEREAAFQILGLPVPGAQTRFCTGFPILAGRRNGGAAPRLDDGQPALHSVQLHDAEWFVFQPGEGEHWFTADDVEDEERIAFEVVEAPDIEPASIKIHPTKPTMSDLRTGQLEIRVNSPLALEEVPVCLRLVTAGQPDIVATDTIDRLPARIVGRSALFKPLLSALKDSHGDFAFAHLKVEIPGFLPFSISFQPVHRDLRFDPSSSQWVGVEDEGRILPSLTGNAQNPLLHKAADIRKGFALLLPDCPDHEALRAGIILSDGEALHLGDQCATPFKLPPLVREADSRNESVGLLDIARSNIAWRLAESVDPLSDWQRRSIVERLEEAAVKLLCGPAWNAIESGINLSILSPHGALLRSARALGLVSGEDLPRIVSAPDRAFLDHRLTARLREAVPTIGDALSAWSEELAGDLDLAVIDAYEDLRGHLQATNREAFDEVDMAREAETWREALERASDVPLLPMFKRLILPETRWDALIRPLYGDLSEDDLVDLLDDSHVDASRRPGIRWLGRPELRVMLQFWLSQRAMIDAEDWSISLVKGLSDVQTARAIRYVALRSKLARLDMPDENDF